jgi:hypothetical protein
MNLILYSLEWTYALFVGFAAYAAIIQAWSKLKIGIKILYIPVLLVFGLSDVLFNLTIGSVLFWERAYTYTFSQRLCQHLNDTGWRGHLAGAFSVPLNAIYPNHIHPNL